MRILVTGSSRLETFQKQGDSLAGRLYTHHLLPFCPDELKGKNKKDIDYFLERGGFPEPFLADDLIEVKK